MSTKTMRLPPRRVSTPNKRKERGDFDAVRPSTTASAKLPKPDSFQAGSEKAAEPVASNQLLAGYLAHEFLTKGTFFGEPYEPGLAQAAPVLHGESRKEKGSQGAESKPSERAEPSEEKLRRYREVAYLMRADGTHLPGIVNPAQLARFLRM